MEGLLTTFYPRCIISRPREQRQFLVRSVVPPKSIRIRVRENSKKHLSPTASSPHRNHIQSSLHSPVQDLTDHLTIMSNTSGAKTGDRLAGMAHSEVHYFNSYNHHGQSLPCIRFGAGNRD